RSTPWCGCTASKLMRAAELDRLAQEARRSAWAVARARRRGDSRQVRRLVSAPARAGRGWTLGESAAAGRARGAEGRASSAGARAFARRGRDVTVAPRSGASPEANGEPGEPKGE